MSDIALNNQAASFTPGLKSLTLNSFRNYENCTLSDLNNRFVILTGANGAGKTNVLEAISLITSSRGFRQARISDVQRMDDGVPWTILTEASTPYGDMRIGVGRDGGSDKRALRIDGQPIKSQSAMADYLRSVWLTPQMDGLFLQSGSERRRFFDRLVTSFDPAHQGRITRYEKALSERSKLLKEAQETGRQADTIWLDGLEMTLTETGTAIAAARIDHLQRLRNHWHSVMPAEIPFPKAIMQLDGFIESRLDAGQSALDIEDALKEALRHSRQRDGIVGGSQIGPHRTDLVVWYQDKNMPASQCSTGEQKALLTGLILAHSRITANLSGIPPILLLDEVPAHLDPNRRAALYDVLSGINTQVWMTGTDANLFTEIPSNHSRFTVHNGIVENR